MDDTARVRHCQGRPGHFLLGRNTHVHPNKEQIYFFLEGEGVLELGTEKKVVRPNQFAFIPPHLPHGLHNTGNGQLVFIVITTLTERG